MIAYLKNKVRVFWNVGPERTLMIKRNIIFSFLIKGAGVLISFLLIPLTIHYVNAGQYGIWLTISSLVVWINTFDIGLSNGLRNKIAHSIALNETTNIVKYISTTYTILFFIALITFVVFYISGSFFNWNQLLNIKPSINANIWPIITISLGAFCIQFVLQPIKSILTATHEPFKSSLLLLLGQCLTVILIYILTLYTKSSLLMLVVVVSSSPVLIFLIANIYLFNTSLKRYSPKFSAIDLKSAKSLLTTGGAFFLIQMGAVILFETDNIIISRILGPSQVTAFNIASKLFSLTTIIFVIMLTPYWSAFTDAYAKNDMKWIKQSIRKMRMIWLYMSIATVILYFFSNIFYKIWVGNTISISNQLSLSMAIYVILSNWQGIYVYALNGIGKLRIQLIFISLAGLLNIPLSVLLIHRVGLPGTVIANIILAIIMNVFYTYQVNLIINQKATGIWNR
ncbi:lipopolysaccharide biosynthesis protein [Mucilaginibacter sp.]